MERSGYLSRIVGPLVHVHVPVHVYMTLDEIAVPDRTLQMVLAEFVRNASIDCPVQRT